jgi:hypothetical protein
MESGRQHDPRNASEKPKVFWPDAAPLVTTRRGIYLENQAQKERERTKYLGEPIDQDKILAFVSNVTFLNPSLKVLLLLMCDYVGLLHLARRRGLNSPSTWL